MKVPLTEMVFRWPSYLARVEIAGPVGPQVGLPRRLPAIKLGSSGRLGCGWGCVQPQDVSARPYEQMRAPASDRVRRKPRNGPWRSAGPCLWQGQVGGAETDKEGPGR